jgi:chemotaxis protein MotB
VAKEQEKINIIVQQGAADWVVTFGDLMSLLLCFFVLLLSFSEMDKAKYKEVAGSLAKAFGVQRKNKAFEAPRGISMIAKDFDQDLVPTHEREEFIPTIKHEEIREELQKEIETRFNDMKNLVQVESKNGKVIIRLMGESTFDSGKATIRKKMTPLLGKISTVLEKTPGEVVVAGHTDNVPLHGGRFKNNLGLSIARASSVAEYLMRTGRIEPSRVATMGFGEFRPIESNDTAEGRRMNRRVEIVLGAASPAA